MSLPCACVGGCPNPAALAWQRRPTADQLAEIVAQEEAQRAAIIAVSDPNNPPQFGPLPTEETTTVPVYACVEHEITMDLAAHTHQSTCTAPNPANLPGCDCTPEPLPDNPDPDVAHGLT